MAPEHEIRSSIYEVLSSLLTKFTYLFHKLLGIYWEVVLGPQPGTKGSAFMGLTVSGRKQPTSTVLFKSTLASPGCLWEAEQGEGLKVERACWRRRSVEASDEMLSEQIPE